MSKSPRFELNKLPFAPNPAPRATQAEYVDHFFGDETNWSEGAVPTIVHQTGPNPSDPWPAYPAKDRIHIEGLAQYICVSTQKWEHGEDRIVRCTANSRDLSISPQDDVGQEEVRILNPDTWVPDWVETKKIQVETVNPDTGEIKTKEMMEARRILRSLNIETTGVMGSSEGSRQVHTKLFPPVRADQFTLYQQSQRIKQAAFPQNKEPLR